MFGNDCTGDINDVRNYLDFIEVDNSNWIGGIKGKFKISAKVFREGSDYGIKYGRISKIQICDTSQEHWGFDKCYMNYDRGWDIRPNDPETIEFINGLLKALGDDELDADDLIYYSLYLYDSEEGFEAGNRDHAGDFDTAEDARSEGNWYLTSDDQIGRPCAVFKVISSDDEEIEIVRREVASDDIVDKLVAVVEKHGIVSESTEEERFTAFAKELGELSTKHGITIDDGTLRIIEK